MEDFDEMNITKDTNSDIEKETIVIEESDEMAIPMDTNSNIDKDTFIIEDADEIGISKEEKTINPYSDIIFIEEMYEIDAPKDKINSIDKDIYIVEEPDENVVLKDKNSNIDKDIVIVEKPDEMVVPEDKNISIDKNVVNVEELDEMVVLEDTNSNIGKNIGIVEEPDGMVVLEDKNSNIDKNIGIVEESHKMVVPEDNNISIDKNFVIVEEGDELLVPKDKNSNNDKDIVSEKLDEKPLLSNNSSKEYTAIEVDAETIDSEVNFETSENSVPEKELEVNYDVCENSIQAVEYDFKHIPYQITGSWKEFTSKTKHNFLRGCKWAPDGSCILTCSDDNILRIFNLPQQLWDPSEWSNISEMEAAVKISEGELIYDYCWYPLMNSTDAASCCLASTSRKSTVHLWDAFTGELRCTYRTFNHMDEIATPHSLSFDADGQRLFCGFEKFVRIFNVDTPGRNFEERQVYAKKWGQPGIISCFAFTSADKNISAAGSYQKKIGIYCEPNGELECLIEGQKGGITQLQFSPDGTYLYSGGRKDPEILCWDIRNLGTVLFSLRRSCTTNQRMYFDISKCGKYIVSGNQNGIVTFWDITREPKIINEDEFSILEPIQFFLAHEDCVNGVSFHPTFPLLCSSSGQRKFPALLGEEEERMFSSKIDKWDNSLRLWWIGRNN